MTRAFLMLFMAAGASNLVLAGEEEGHFDAWVFLEDGRLKTGTADVDEGIFTSHVRVFESELGETTPDFADEPGFYSETLLPGMSIGFNILDSLRVWDGSTFDTVSPVTMTLWEAFGVPGSDAVTTPAVPGVVGGFNFAMADGSGAIDDHPEFVLNAPATDGIYLLQLELTSPDATRSLPLFLVFNQNMDEEDHEAAVEYARTLVPAPGGAAAFTLLGMAGLMRRRRNG